MSSYTHLQHTITQKLFKTVVRLKTTKDKDAGDKPHVSVRATITSCPVTVSVEPQGIVIDEAGKPGVKAKFEFGPDGANYQSRTLAQTLYLDDSITDTKLVQGFASCCELYGEQVIVRYDEYEHQSPRFESVYDLLRLWRDRNGKNPPDASACAAAKPTPPPAPRAGRSSDMIDAMRYFEAEFPILPRMHFVRI